MQDGAASVFTDPYFNLIYLKSPQQSVFILSTQLFVPYHLLLVEGLIAMILCQVLRVSLPWCVFNLHVQDFTYLFIFKKSIALRRLIQNSSVSCHSTYGLVQCNEHTKNVGV